MLGLPSWGTRTAAERELLDLDIGFPFPGEAIPIANNITIRSVLCKKLIYKICLM